MNPRARVLPSRVEALAGRSEKGCRKGPHASDICPPCQPSADWDELGPGIDRIDHRDCRGYHAHGAFMNSWKWRLEGLPPEDLRVTGRRLRMGGRDLEAARRHVLYALRASLRRQEAVFETVGQLCSLREAGDCLEQLWCSRWLLDPVPLPLKKSSWPFLQPSSSFWQSAVLASSCSCRATS